MKPLSQFRCILFALVVPFAACGGGDSPKSSDHKTQVVDTLDRKADGPEKTSGFGKKVEEIKPAELAPEHYIPTKFGECMSLGKELEAKGEHGRARELFEAAAKLDRKQAEPMVELARSYISTSEKGLAIKHANKAVKLAPESSQAYNTLGRAELLRHDYDAAVIAFRQATELNADNVWAWNNLGLVHLTLKNYQEAANALAEATSRKGTEGYMWNNLGLAYEQMDQLDEAREAFDSGAKLGSAIAKASRKRLEGVDTIVVTKTAKTETKPEIDQTYELREPMPEDVDDVEDVEDIDVEPDDEEKGELEVDVQVDEAIVDEPDDSEQSKEETPTAPPTTL